MQTNLRFLFVLKKRKLQPLEGTVAPDREFWEAVSLPGNLSAAGDSLESAVTSLQGVIDAFLEREQSEQSWYREARRRMSPQEDQVFQTMLKRFFFSDAKFEDADRFQWASVNAEPEPTRDCALAG